MKLPSSLFHCPILILAMAGVGCSEADRYPTMRDATQFDCKNEKRLAVAKQDICTEIRCSVDPVRDGVSSCNDSVKECSKQIAELRGFVERVVSDPSCALPARIVSLVWEKLDAQRRELESRIETKGAGAGGGVAGGTEQAVRIDVKTDTIDVRTRAIEQAISQDHWVLVETSETSKKNNKTSDELKELLKTSNEENGSKFKALVISINDLDGKVKNLVDESKV